MAEDGPEKLRQRRVNLSCVLKINSSLLGQKDPKKNLKGPRVVFAAIGNQE